MDNWLIFKLNGVKKQFVLIGCLILSGSALGFDFSEATAQMQNDLNRGDSASFFAHFLPDARLYHLGDEGLEMIELADFVPVLKKFRNKEYREDFTKIEVRELETGLTHVDVHFSFYINETFAFAGIDHVIWVKENAGYRIANLYTGVLKPKFASATGQASTTIHLDSLMNKWHNDVATFAFDDYFNFMTSGFIFLGTDPSERWTKDQFSEFCQPYFEKKSTWDFKTNWRNWYLSENGDVAWFEESLATWMDECRGSGVLINENGTWKIAHYNLSVLIENEKVDKFIKLRKK
ncbi:MAG: nuclear transport factor 2 family protein [Bacteroidetes bacterium]|nr:nuclear transport factor 2 family protein [Bacteroidota bacterium]